MNDSGFTVFDTSVGTCGIAWRPEGLAAVLLPEATADQTLARLERRCAELAPASPPAWVETVIGRIRALLSGVREDLADVPVDWSLVGEFEASVLRAARAIPPGETLTYGEVAERIGDPGQARAVGQALGHNPWPIVVPCHRVTAAAGRAGGFSAPGGASTKLKLLEIEGALAVERLPLFAEPRSAWVCE